MFDKNMKTPEYKDFSLTLYLGDDVLTALRHGAYILRPGADYTVDGGSYTIRKEYLATLDLGQQGIEFVMSRGYNPVLRVIITDSRRLYRVLEHFDDFTGSGTSSARIDADYREFVRLWHDGEVVDPANYTITEGSTVITLKEHYLKTFRNGVYWFTAEFNDGWSEDIRLLVNVPGHAVPQTGDYGAQAGWMLVLLGSLLGMACMLVWGWKREASR
ncbi:MAG: hypothetical protein LBU47_03130 [Christensenellaceae bacterium]|nr:hypothetical protein [Christensenellaceae bacterium]